MERMNWKIDVKLVDGTEEVLMTLYGDESRMRVSVFLTGDEALKLARELDKACGF